MANQEEAQDSKKLPRIPPMNFGKTSMFSKGGGANLKGSAPKSFVPPTFRVTQNKGSGGK